jgi:hypothetical protein
MATLIIGSPFLILLVSDISFYWLHASTQGLMLMQ